MALDSEIICSHYVLPARNWLGGWTVETVNLDTDARHDDAEQHRHDGGQIE